MKKFVRFISLAMIFAIALSLCACGGKADDATTTHFDGAEKMSEVDLSALENTTAATTAAPTTTNADTGETETTTGIAQIPMPKTKAEILEYYNMATANVASKKVAFSKTRFTEEKTYEAGVALSAFKSIVCQFMGIGSDNAYNVSVEKNDKNYDRYIKASNLTEKDIKDASIKQSGSDYVITIKVVDGSSSITGGEKFMIYAPIDNCGIGHGLNDKDYYDHKTAQNIYDAIDEVGDKANIVEKYSNAVVTATIDSATGNIKSIKVVFDIDFNVSNVLGSKGNASGTTTVDYKDFKW